LKQHKIKGVSDQSQQPGGDCEDNDAKSQCKTPSRLKASQAKGAIVDQRQPLGEKSSTKPISKVNTSLFDSADLSSFKFLEKEARKVRFFSARAFMIDRKRDQKHPFVVLVHL
jgi:hypothetical protein